MKETVIDQASGELYAPVDLSLPSAERVEHNALIRSVNRAEHRQAWERRSFERHGSSRQRKVPEY